MKYREKSIKRKSFLMTKCLTVALLAVVFSLSVVCLYGEERSDCVMATEGDDGDSLNMSSIPLAPAM